MIIDFHSHILPKMDDGSSGSDESMEMLKEAGRQGITHIVATSHFYSDEEAPEDFLKRRNGAMMRLLQKSEEMDKQTLAALPVIIPGAEALLYEGMGNSDEIEKLCIQGTDCLLVEMPFRKWTERTLREILQLQEVRGFQVILAHIERYLSWNKLSVFDQLKHHGILFQCNGEFFGKGLFSGKAYKMMGDGYVDLLGSDCHNTTTRPQNLGEARALIKQKAGENWLQTIDRRGEKLLNLNK